MGHALRKNREQYVPSALVESCYFSPALDERGMEDPGSRPESPEQPPDEPTSFDGPHDRPEISDLLLSLKKCLELFLVHLRPPACETGEQ